MNATYENVELFKNIVSVIKQLTDDVEFYISPESFAIQSMDMAHICMIDLCLYSSAFENYDVEEEEITIGLSLLNLERILNMGKKTDSLVLNCPQESDLLKISISSPKKTIDFNLNLIDVDQERIDPGEIPYSHVINMDSKEFETTIKDILSVGDDCRIKVTDDKVTFEVTGDSGTGTFTFDEDEAQVVTESENDINSRFNPKYLGYFGKCSKLSKTVEIKLIAEKLPLCCTYDMGDIGYIRFYLAPMDDDDE